MMENRDLPETPDRRSFLKKTSAALIGAIAGLFPFAAGLAVFMDPLRRKSEESGLVRVASLEAVPSDGLPRKFSVITDRVDAWNKRSQAPVGAVYLRRTRAQEIEALNVVCPHAGCFVDFLPGRKGFFCPCHNSSFGLDGRIDDPKSPSPRALDSLEVEIRNGNEVWVRFQNFRAGEKEKIPVA